MNLKRHIAAIIRRNPNNPNFCAERILKLVEGKSTPVTPTHSCSTCFYSKDYLCTNTVHCENVELWSPRKTIAPLVAERSKLCNSSGPVQMYQQQSENDY